MFLFLFFIEKRGSIGIVLSNMIRRRWARLGPGGFYLVDRRGRPRRRAAIHFSLGGVESAGGSIAYLPIYLVASTLAKPRCKRCAPNRIQGKVWEISSRAA